MEYHTVEDMEKNENVLETVQEQPSKSDLESQDTNVFGSPVPTMLSTKVETAQGLDSKTSNVLLDLQLHGVEVAALDEKMTYSEKSEIAPQREVLVIRDFPPNALPLPDEDQMIALQKNKSLVNEKSGEEEQGDPRTKLRETLCFFRMVYRKFLLEESDLKEEIGKRESIDSQVVKILKDKGKYLNTDKQIMGPVPGIEVGDRFQYRLELSITGIHSEAQCGIGYIKNGETVLATSLLAFGGYFENMHSTNVIFYRTEGDEEALINSYCAQTLIRVIRLVEGSSSSSNCRGEAYVYDGLYSVVKWEQEIGPEGKVVHTFELHRNADQPKLGSYLPKWPRTLRKGGVVVHRDISQGREMIPISAVNTTDSNMPPQFEYVSNMLYPDWFSPVPRNGCNCTHGCSNLRECSCVVINGGEIPYNQDGTIVKSKPHVFECGPTCRCPPSCQNRVSQHGIKFRLEIFKDTHSWGVRSLNSIPKGSFVCEYSGELKAEDTYYTDTLQYLNDFGSCKNDNPAELMRVFTIDTTQKGNVGRFMNRSLFPNLFVQSVFYDHDNKEVPHIMLFAKRDIPPMEEMSIKFSIPRLVLDILIFKGLHSFEIEEDDGEDEQEDNELDDEED